MVTVELTLVSGLFGVIMGVLAAVAQMSRFPPLRWAAMFYIWVLRGTPLLVQILFVYFALPHGRWRSPTSHSAALALGLNVGAYNAEAIRAGIQAIPRGPDRGGPLARAQAASRPSRTWSSRRG